MGYRDALVARTRKLEGGALQKSAAKKGLWGSIGRTVGGLVATTLTGGVATPWAVGLMAGGGSLLGGAAGSAVSNKYGGKLKGGTFYKEEAASLQTELGAFGSRNLTESLKSGLTAGIGQKLKLAKEGRAAVAGGATPEAGKIIAKGKGFDFAESTVGRGWDKYVTQPKAIKAAGEQARLGEYLQQSGDFATEFGEGLAKSKAAALTRSSIAAGKEAELGGFLRRESDFATEFGGGKSAPTLWSKIGEGIKGVGDYGKAVVGTAQYRIGQGLEEGAKYNQQIPWDVVPREQDISAEPLNIKNKWDWNLGGSWQNKIFR